MEKNNIYELAFEVIANTSRSVFITGKAGSGKTTFLKRLAKEVDKVKAIAAPTGIAAINAGGVTLHSLFHLPLELFTPDEEGRSRFDLLNNIHKSKIEVLRSLDIVIIDEVSMVRADILDAIDYRLKKIKKNDLPFGGVQMVFIGDLFQLPPIVKNSEAEEFYNFYKSSFFFDSKVIINNIPICIELNKNYRQKDKTFLEILNKIRNNQIDSKALEQLNNRYLLLKDVSKYGEFNNDEKAIFLTTHNNSADKINTKELAKINSKVKKYTAYVKGDFSENLYPTEFTLELKIGARIMFVRNDGGNLSRFYNGKLGIVLELYDEKIVIECDDGDIIELERNRWKNVRYKHNKETQKIEEESIGEFLQFPIRLAWAITIHRSQGLTFDNIVIDAANSFAEGQVYVALSRCRTLEGIILTSKISQNAIKTNKHAVIFETLKCSEKDIEEILEIEKKPFLISKIQKKFNFEPLKQIISNWSNLISSKKKLCEEKDQVHKSIIFMLSKTSEIIDVGNSFQTQLKNIIISGDENKLLERSQKAIKYFHNYLTNNFKLPIYSHLKIIREKKIAKKDRINAENIFAAICNMIDNLECIYYQGKNLSYGIDFAKENEVITAKIDKKTKEKKQIGETKKISLEMFREGKTIDQITKERGLTKNTIENHLISFVETGELKGSELLGVKKINVLIKEIKELGTVTSLKGIKENLTNEYSYFEIKIALETIKLLSKK